MQQENAIRVRRISRLGKDEQAHPSKADTTYPLHRSFHRLVLAKRREFLHMHPRNCTETALGCHVSLTLINGCPLGVINGPGGPEIRLPLFPRKRTQVGHRAMSEKSGSQNRTWDHLAEWT